MTNTIFSCQTTLKKAKFLEFGLKNANLATLILWPQMRATFHNYGRLLHHTQYARSR